MLVRDFQHSELTNGIKREISFGSDKKEVHEFYMLETEVALIRTLNTLKSTVNFWALWLVATIDVEQVTCFTTVQHFEVRWHPKAKYRFLTLYSTLKNTLHMLIPTLSQHCLFPFDQTVPIEASGFYIFNVFLRDVTVRTRKRAVYAFYSSQPCTQTVFSY